MTLIDGVRLWFIVVWSVAIVGFLVSAVKFRSRQDNVEEQAGPLPTPLSIFNFIVLLLLLTRTGEIATDNATGWMLLRVVGVGLSLYGLALLPWTVRTLGRLAAPGPAVLKDHELITAGPFQLVRHPGYSAILAIFLGTALGTLNWILLVLWPLVLAGTFLTSRAEERLLREKFGADYDDYAEQTNRLIPGPW